MRLTVTQVSLLFNHFQVFSGNTDASTIVTNMFLFPFEAKQIKLIPIEWNLGISLRWEVLGCLGGTFADIPWGKKIQSPTLQKRVQTDLKYLK